MNIFIVDSGSTKADWLHLQDGQVVDQQETFGFNPFNSDGEAFINAAQRALAHWPLNDTELEIYYYGTGCASLANQKKTIQLLRMLCNHTKRIEVHSDLYGACLAACGKEAGLVAILGTGTNSCLYDGKQIVDQLPSLGYRGGDPASGYDLGQRLLQHYAWRTCPAVLADVIDKEYPEGIEQLKKELYQSLEPNIFLAKFAAYLIKHRSEEFVQELVTKSITFFISSILSKYDKSTSNKVNFVGSIAFFFSEILEKCLQSHGFQLGAIIQRPISNLAEYHKLKKTL